MKTKNKKSTGKSKKVLLLENINPIAVDLFIQQGYEVNSLKGALSEADLIQTVPDYDALGIRSKTLITPKVLKACPDLMTIGCFCVGTNQVDLKTSKVLGLPVFNAPFSNTRSVAEMTLGNLISLSRKIGDRNREMHEGIWKKESESCFEIRGKSLGIIGYGNVGSQVSHLAEAAGMRVFYYDIIEKLPLGNAQPSLSLHELLRNCDFVSLHVPETPQTMGMIGAEELAQMKPGSYLLNSSRGSVVDLEALKEVLSSGHLAGAALDVYPEEPEKNSEGFRTPVQKLKNVILTPHIGGATEEAQVSIGKEVASTLIRFLEYGATTNAVNFPRLDLPRLEGAYRFINIHKNIPGVLKEIHRVVSEAGANILAESLSTDSEIGYLLTDLNQPISAEDIRKINACPGVIRTL